MYLTVKQQLKHLPKDGYTPLIVQQFTIRNQIFTLPYLKQYGVEHSKLKVINYCLFNDIGILVCGYNIAFQRDIHMGRVNNQNFVNVPYGKIRQTLAHLCEFYGFEYHEIHRGLYRTSTGFEFNADVNGALNILRKSNVVSLLGLYTRGELAAPLRIRL